MAKKKQKFVFRGWMPANGNTGKLVRDPILVGRLKEEVGRNACVLNEVPKRVRVTVEEL